MDLFDSWVQEISDQFSPNNYNLINNNCNHFTNEASQFLTGSLIPDCASSFVIYFFFFLIKKLCGKPLMKQSCETVAPTTAQHTNGSDVEANDREGSIFFLSRNESRSRLDRSPHRPWSQRFWPRTFSTRIRISSSLRIIISSASWCFSKEGTRVQGFGCETEVAFFVFVLCQ